MAAIPACPIMPALNLMLRQMGRAGATLKGGLGGTPGADQGYSGEREGRS
ncbi:hypothetical protein GCM10010211_63300 [Streptomyces albospinus]|uniref:Uncharacterized protein n=1 Tax=Streptomyces albospinus TaxID=285515 RepID=A0ABQ2VI42_9ACTN|nr:hypothetical protein GCM10010211_63300 [Streptomyces albospinus]